MPFDSIFDYLPDHPVIRNMERTGYPDGKEPKEPKCPFCGEMPYEIYTDPDRKCVGCESCVIEDTGDESMDRVCPVCGQDCEDFYFRDNEIVGCERCLTTSDPYDNEDCFRHVLND